MTLQELAARVDASDGADDELRKDVLLAVDPDCANMGRDNIGGAKRIFSDTDDAAALVHRALVGDYNQWAVFKSASRRSPFVARITVDGSPSGEIIYTHKHSAAMALVVTLLRALAAKDTGQ